MRVALRIIGIIAACVGIYFSWNMLESSKDIVIPDKRVSVSSSSRAYDYSWGVNIGAQYLGGDAYNYIVEASLKAGYYNATVVKKTIREVGGTALLFFSGSFLLFSLYSLSNCIRDNKQVSEKELTKENDTRYQQHALRHLKNIESNTIHRQVPPESKMSEQTQG